MPSVRFVAIVAYVIDAELFVINNFPVASYRSASMSISPPLVNAPGVIHGLIVNEIGPLPDANENQSTSVLRSKIPLFAGDAFVGSVSGVVDEITPPPPMTNGVAADIVLP